MKKLVTKNKGQLIWRHRIDLLTFHCKIDSTKEMIKGVMNEMSQTISDFHSKNTFIHFLLIDQTLVH